MCTEFGGLSISHITDLQLSLTESLPCQIVVAELAIPQQIQDLSEQCAEKNIFRKREKLSGDWRKLIVTICSQQTQSDRQDMQPTPDTGSICQNLSYI